MAINQTRKREWEKSKLTKIPGVRFVYYSLVQGRLLQEHKEILANKDDPYRVNKGQVKLDEAWEAFGHLTNCFLELVIGLVTAIIVASLVL